MLETCRYRFVNGKVATKMFGMKGADWDIDPGWCHSPKDARAAAENPQPEPEPELQPEPEPKPKKRGRKKKGK